MLHKYVIEMCENFGIVVGVDVHYIKQKRAVRTMVAHGFYVYQIMLGYKMCEFGKCEMGISPGTVVMI